MGWSEYSTFVLNGNEKTIRKIHHALRKGSVLPEEFKKYRLHYCELAIRLGQVTLDEVLNAYKQASEIETRGPHYWNFFHTKNLPLGCTTIDNVQYHPTKDKNTLSFDLNCWKDFACKLCHTLLTTRFPSLKVCFCVSDDMDCGFQGPQITNDKEGKYFPQYTVSSGFAYKRIYDRYCKKWIKGIRSSIDKGFQTQEEAQAYIDENFPASKGYIQKTTLTTETGEYDDYTYPNPYKKHSDLQKEVFLYRSYVLTK